MPSKAFKLAEAMVSNPLMSDMVENPTATPTQIAAVENKTSAISDTGIISVNTKNIVSNNVLTQSFDSNQVVGFNLTDSINAVSPIVSVFKEVPQAGFSSKGQWDVNSNATNYDFYDEKPISYTSSTLTPSATGDGTFTISPTSTTTYTLQNSSYSAGFSVTSQTSNPRDVAFKNDGTKMYVLSSTKYIYEYSLSTAYDATTASYVGSINLGPLESAIFDTYGLRFKSDGTKVYVVDYYGKVWQFSLSTAWSISTTTYDSVSITGVVGSDGPPYAFTFKPDGTKLFAVADRRLYEWVLSTAWDLSSASISNQASGKNADYLQFTTYTNSNSHYAFDFAADGTKFVVQAVGSNGSSVGTGLFEVPISSAWDPLNSTTNSLSSDGTLGTNVVRYTGFFDATGGNTVTGFQFINSGNSAAVVLSYNNTGTVYILDTSASSPPFLSTDVGKKVVGNSGSAIITGTSGTYTSVTAFADTSAISSWQLFGAQGKADGSGIELTGFQLPHTNIATPTHTKTYTWPTSYTKVGGMKISPDGTNFYAAHYGNGAAGLVHRFSLSTPYDITTATFTETGEFSQIKDILWNSDGTKLYGLKYYTTVGIGTKIASTPYSLANMTDGTTITSTFATDAGGGHHMKGFCFSADKTQLYIANHGTNYFYQYSLDGNPGEIDSGLTYVGSAASGINNPHSVEMQADGTKIWFTTFLEGASSRYHYLPLSTAFDITSAGSRAQHNFPSPANSVGGNSRTPIFTFNEDQTIMYVSSTGNADATDNIFQFDIGTAVLPYSTYSPALTNSSTGQINSSSWQDINSMTADETKNDGDIFYAVSTDNRTSWGVAKASDGVRKIARNNSGTWQYNNNAGTSTTVNLGFSLASPSYDNKSYTVSHSNPRGMYLKSDGTELYIGAYTGHVYQFTLSTPNDISTASSTGNYNIDEENDTVALTFKPDGTKMYAASGTNVHQYTLSTAWDITTASYDSVSYTPSDIGSSNIHSLNFNSNGTKLFISDDGSSDKRIREYSLSTPYVVSSASTTSNYLYHNKANVRGVDFNSDGTKIFLSSYSTQSVYQYNLASPYTLSSSQGTTADAEYDASSVISSGMYSMAFSNDGAKLFILESNTDTVKQFSTTESQNTIAYGNGETWIDGTNNNEHATLQEALTSQAFNRMNKAQLDAIADANHFSQDSADTLDLMIAPYAASGTSPISDGVTINYDAEALVREAVPGTDYIAEFPNSLTINIKSLVNANMKVRAL